VRVRTDGNPGALGRDDAKPVDIEILAVRIGVDLERGAGVGGTPRDPLPVARETGAEVVDPSAGMGEDLYVRILQAAEVALGLVVA